MSTISVVRKNDEVAIAADTLTNWGSTKESAEYIVNFEKIFRFKDNYFGFTGSAVFQSSVQQILTKTRKKLTFESVDSIFQAAIYIHSELKDRYFLRADDDDSFETSRGDFLIANPHGIFGVSSFRYVQEFRKFFSHGSGCDYALGAMFATYSDSDKSAEDIAKIGTSAGIEFDDGSGLPLESYTIKLKK